ncbi:MAG TPA: DUF2569 family protein [Longimicrobium sp.]|nr:DUF2569 family protein [Longimicrobium sp.]
MAPGRSVCGRCGVGALGPALVLEHPFGARPAASGAMCAAHQAAATRICARCGRFACTACDGDGGLELCPECTGRLKADPPRIRGGLLLAAVALFAAPLVALVQLIGVVGVAQESGWAAFVSPRLFGSPYAFALVHWTVASSLGTIGLAGFTIPDFLGRRRGAPRLMKLFFAANCAFVLGAYALAWAARLGPNPMVEGTFVLALTGVWWTYFESSERVRRTFIR